MKLYRTIKHEKAERIVLSMRRYRVNKNERQDRGASSQREIITKYAPTYAFTPFFLTIDIL